MARLTQEEIEIRRKLVLQYSNQADIKKEHRDVWQWVLKYHRDWFSHFMPKKHLNGTFSNATIEELIEMAKPFVGKTRTDVRNHSGALANQIAKYDLWDQCGIVLPTNVITDRIHYVYVYEYPQNNVAYVGRTHWGDAGDLREKQHTTDITDNVCKYAIDNKIPVANKKILEDNLTLEESVKGEKYWMAKYRSDGWTLLNKAPGGSIGSLIRNAYTELQYIEDLKQYGSKLGEIKPKYYNIARKRGWYEKYKDIIFTNPKRQIPVRAIAPDGTITDFDSIAAAAKALGIHSSSKISDVLYNKSTQCKGYYFMYPT